MGQSVFSNTELVGSSSFSRSWSFFYAIGYLFKMHPHSFLVQIQSLTWNDSDSNHKNYPPTEMDTLDILSTTRVVRLLPLNWTDRALWISGLTVLLRRSMNQPIKEQLSAAAAAVAIEKSNWSDTQSAHGSVTSSSYGPRSSQSSPRKGASGRRRSMTVIANESSTPTLTRKSQHGRHI